MRTALCWTVSCLALGLAAVVGVAPASLAQNPRVLGHGKPAATGIGADERQTHDEKSDGLRSGARGHTGVSVAVPIGRVWVGPEFVDGEPSYVRRTTVSNGMTMV